MDNATYEMLVGWITIHTQSVYGSPDNYVPVDELLSKLDALKNPKERY